MSVKVHEPVCLDSAQDLYFWMDHFLGDQVKDEWRDVGAGSVAVVDAQTGGIVRITSGAVAAQQHVLDWNDIRTLHVTKKLTGEARLKLEQATTMECRLYFWFDGSNIVGFRFDDSTDVNWQILTVDVAATISDSGIAPDTSYHVFRFECHTHGSNHVHFYIDGVETANSPITTNIPDDAGDFLQPYIRVTTEENAAHYVDVDYVVARQER